MYTQNVTINNEVGLHARPATFFIQKANEFKSGIWLEKDERRVNAKSFLGVLSLGIVKGCDGSLRAGFQQFRRIKHDQERRLQKKPPFSILFSGFDLIYY